MPDKNGIEALKEMMEAKKDVKVIMLSSSGTKSHLKAAMDAGASDLSKTGKNLRSSISSGIFSRKGCEICIANISVITC